MPPPSPEETEGSAAKEPPQAPQFWEALRWWLKLGFINFGGPTGQIAVMHQELVERRRWISNDRFLHALNFCMLLPGPEAQQLAVYIGWLFHRTLGGIIAGLLFIIPGFFCILGLSWLYAVHGEVAWVAAVFYGLRAAVVGIVAAAVISIGSKALRTRFLWSIAAASFVFFFFLEVPFPLIIIGSGLLGLLVGRRWPEAFPGAGQGGASAQAAPDDQAPLAEHTRPKLARAAKVLLVGLLLWWGPLGLVIVWRGWDDVLSQEAVFFSKAAMVTFGGAYAVLGYINHAAVETYGWLDHGQMATGLGLAESTPGPLIMVTEFVGFLAAYRHPGGLDPLQAATLGAAVTTWATFAPCFLWIFLGAPFIEALRGKRALSAALSTITAAVVGVVLDLAVWFAIHTLFRRVGEVKVLGSSLPVPEPASVDLFAAAVAAVAFLVTKRLKWNIVFVVLASATAGLMREFLA